MPKRAVNTPLWALMKVFELNEDHWMLIYMAARTTVECEQPLTIENFARYAPFHTNMCGGGIVRPPEDSLRMLAEIGLIKVKCWDPLEFELTRTKAEMRPIGPEDRNRLVRLADRYGSDKFSERYH